MAVTLTSIQEEKIYGVRSALPCRFVSDTVAEYFETITIDLKIWNGDDTTAKPSADTYSFSLNANVLGTNLTSYEVDIAEFVREYINTDNFTATPVTSYAQDWAAWVEISWTATIVGGDTTYSDAPIIICTNGWRAYDDPTLALDTYYFPVSVQVPGDKVYFITVLDNGVTGAARILDEIEIDYDISAAASTAFGTAGSTTASLFKTVALSWGANDTKATVKLMLSSAVVFSFEVFRYCKSKYVNQVIGYTNRLGVMDFIFTFGKNENNQNVTRANYKPALNSTYTAANAQYRISSANGKQPFTTNTDFVPQETREKIRDLLLTEYAIITDATSTTLISKAIVPTDSDQVMKQDNNEMSNYTLSFEYAYDTINSVR
jgi:hypothetical protein